MTGAAIAQKLGLARSTVSRWLKREGLGRLSRLDLPEPVRRYQRERPGKLIHLDIKKLGRFDRPGHRITGTRAGCRNKGAGWDFVHVAIDDATRLAYVEVLGGERSVEMLLSHEFPHVPVEGAGLFLSCFVDPCLGLYHRCHLLQLGLRNFALIALNRTLILAAYYPTLRVTLHRYNIGFTE